MVYRFEENKNPPEMLLYTVVVGNKLLLIDRNCSKIESSHGSKCVEAAALTGSEIALMTLVASYFQDLIQEMLSSVCEQ